MECTYITAAGIKHVHFGFVKISSPTPPWVKTGRHQLLSICCS